MQPGTNIKLRRCLPRLTLNAFQWQTTLDLLLTHIWTMTTIVQISNSPLSRLTVALFPFVEFEPIESPVGGSCDVSGFGCMFVFLADEWTFCRVTESILKRRWLMLRWLMDVKPDCRQRNEWLCLQYEPRFIYYRHMQMRLERHGFDSHQTDRIAVGGNFASFLSQ